MGPVMGVVTRIVPYAAGALALWALLSRLQELAGPLAVVLAVCVIAGIVHASGRYAWMDRYPKIGRLLDFYAPRFWPASPAGRGPIAGGPQAAAAVVPAPRPVRPPRKVSSLNALIGIEDQREQLEKLIGSRAFRDGTHAPATLIALVGARGTGKKSVAWNLPAWLHEEGVVKSREVRVISRDALPGLADGFGVTAETRHEIRQQACDALGGTLIVEDIDKLIGPQTAFAVGECLADVANQYPGRLMVVATGSLSAYGSLDPQHQWRQRFNVCEIEFGDLDDDALSEIFLRLVAERGLVLEPAAKNSLQRRIGQLRGQNVSPFLNAVTMGALFHAVLSRLPRGEQKVTALDIREARLPT